MLQFGDNLWIADGPPVSVFGPITLPTRMTVVRLGDGSAWINSPVEPSSDLLERVKAIGPVRYLVAPTPPHVWRLEAWSALFPDAQLWGPPGIRRRAGERAFTGCLEDVAPPAWAVEIEQAVFRGNTFFDEVEFYHRSSRTLMMTDFIQNYPAVAGDVVGNFVKSVGGALNGGVPRDIRWSCFDKAAARRSLAKLLAWDFDKVVVAHGACVERDAGGFVRKAFCWLDP